MVNRNWTTPFEPRETLRDRRTQKKCDVLEDDEYLLNAYDTCAVRFKNTDFGEN